MSFPDDFERLVAPVLALSVKAQGLFVAIGCRTWIEATDAVWGIAIARGALHLPAAAQTALDDWIATALLERITAVAPLWAEAEARADRVARDIERLPNAQLP